MKKTLSLIVLVLILALGAWAYYSKEKPLPASGNERGIISSATENTLILETADGRQQAYETSSTTTVFSETLVSTDSLSEGSAAYAISNPETDKLLSVTMVQDESMLPIVEDQSWFVTGTIEGVSDHTVVIRNDNGALRDFIIEDQVVLLSNKKTGIGSLRPGDRAIVSWSTDIHNTRQATIIVVPAQ